LKKSVNADNFTPKYDEVEDRIRLSINYDDIQNRVDFMITRSFIIKLFPVLDEYMSRHYSLDLSPQVSVSAPVATQNKPDAKLTSPTDGANLELYKQDDELLTEMNFSYNPKNKITMITFSSHNSQAIAKLDSHLMKQVFLILKSSIPFFSWGISQNL